MNYLTNKISPNSNEMQTDGIRQIEFLVTWILGGRKENELVKGFY